MMENRKTINEIKELLRAYYNANINSKKNGWDEKYTLCIRGIHGLGKTSIIRQFAKEIGVNVQVVRLSQFDDVSQLTGKPITTLEVIKNNDANTITRISEKYIDYYINNGYDIINNSEIMTYSIPDFVANIKPGDILLFDDFGRQFDHFNNAVMEIINEGKYHNWSLPENVVIFLTKNPTDGNYQVSEQDDAQEDRIQYVDIEFSVNDWSSYAEKEGIADEFINFMHQTPEAITTKLVANDESKTETNVSIRKWTNLFKFIQSLVDKKDIKKNLNLIYQTGASFVGNRISQLISFLENNELSNLPRPEELLDLSINDQQAIDNIKSFFNKKDLPPGGQVLLSFRIINYLLSNKEKLDISNPKFSNRVISILKSEHFDKENKNFFILSIAKDSSFMDIYKHYADIMK